MDLGLGSNPKLHRAQKGPFRVRIEARQRWAASTRVSRRPRLEADLCCSVTEMKKMMIGNARGGVWLRTRALPEKAEPTPLRNEASLNCVSLRAKLDWEVTCGAVKGQDERRPSAAPLTAPQVTPELYAARKKQARFHGKTDKTGRHVGP